jgi:uncharacterized SAM-binding protein YcdF (DUF218 family)
MLRRTAAIIVLVWAMGFLWFANALPQGVEGGKTDGVIVLTGGEGRIDRGLTALRQHWAGKLLVSGVDREVKPREFAAGYHVEGALMRCCITLGYESVDTRSNGEESARWIASNKFQSVRLVTTDWHMRRAAFELRRAAPAGTLVIEDAVSSRPTFRTLFMEYHKLLARLVWQLWGG